MHIRVTMVLGVLGEEMRRYAEMAAFAAAADRLVGYITWNLASFAWVSFQVQ